MSRHTAMSLWKIAQAARLTEEQLQLLRTKVQEMEEAAKNAKGNVRRLLEMRAALTKRRLQKFERIARGA